MKLEWSACAVEDRIAIFDYIEADDPRAAALVDDRICAQLAQLIAHPNSGRIGRVAGTRELVVDHAPYVVAYRVEVDRVLILRVLHSARQWPEALPTRN